jgi:hypothetical protein
MAFGNGITDCGDRCVFGGLDVEVLRASSSDALRMTVFWVR